MHGNSETPEGAGFSLEPSINKGVELLLRRRKPQAKRFSFGNWSLPFLKKEVSFYLEIRKL